MDLRIATQGLLALARSMKSTLIESSGISTDIIELVVGKGREFWHFCYISFLDEKQVKPLIYKERPEESAICWKSFDPVIYRDS